MLGDAELWYDEVATALFAALPLHDIFGWLTRVETNPPVYFAALHLWVNVAGEAEVALRLPSALAGIAAVAATMLLATRCFGPRAGIWAGLVIAVAAWHVMQSRDARAYAFLVLFFALALLAARRLAEVAPRQRIRAAWLAVLLGCLGATMPAMHHTGLIAAATAHAYGLWHMAARREAHVPTIAWFGAAGLVCVLLSMPMLVIAVDLAADPSNATSWMHEQRWVRIGHSLQAHLTAAPIMLVRDGLLRAVVAAAGGAFTLFILARLVRAHGSRTEILAFAGTVATAVLLFLAAEAITPVMLDRTLSFLMVPVAILIGAAIAEDTSARSRAGVFVAFSAIQAPMLLACFDPPWHRQASRLAALVAAGPGTIVMTNIFDVASVERYGRGTTADMLVPTAVGIGLQHRMVEVLGRPRIIDAEALARRACGADRVAPPLRIVESLRGPGLRDALDRAGWTLVAADTAGVYGVDIWEPPECELPAGSTR
nr:glycosyltransferase family 39 protein [Neoroseomonas nitratireducens]